MKRMREANNDLYTLLVAGQQVRLDKGRANSSIVEVVRQTPKGLYTIVTNGESEWSVMTYRLTPCN